MEISEQWESPKNEGHKCPADTYGGEHLLRLLGMVQLTTAASCPFSIIYFTNL